MISNKTITSIFMVPTININKQALLKNNFINAYSKDIGNDIDYEDSVFLLFLPKDIDSFRRFLEEEYERTKDIIEDYDYAGGYVVVVYKLNPEFKEDFDKVRNSKYSSTSKKFQKLFPQKVRLKGSKEFQDSVQYLIFTKDTQLLDFWEEIIGTTKISSHNLEVWPGYNELLETLDIKNLII